MKKLILTLIFLTALSIIAWKYHISKSTSANNKPIIKIGVTLPLTGDSSYVGVPAKKAIELALRDIKKDQNLKYDYELIIEDDGLDNKNIMQNYNRFKNIHHVNAIISIWSKTLIINQHTEKDKIIHIGCAWGNEFAKGYYNLNHSTFLEERIPLLIAEFKKRNIKKIGFIYSVVYGDTEIMSKLIPILKQEGFEIVFEVKTDFGNKEFRTEISKIKNKQIDILFTLLVSPSMETFLKQATEQGYKPNYTGFDVLGYKPELFEGNWYIADALGTVEFNEYFKKETGEEIKSCTPNIYDSLKLIVKGYENAPQIETSLPNNQDVVETILNLKDFQSITGDVYIDQDGNIHASPSVAIIKNNKIIPAGE